MPIVLLSWDMVFHRWAAVMDSITQADDGSLVSKHTNHTYTIASIMASNIVDCL